MATAPVQIKLSLEINVNGDGSVGIDKKDPPPTPAETGPSEWDPGEFGIKKLKLFAGTGTEVVGHVIIMHATHNPEDGYTAGMDHWIWLGASWIDCFRMESYTDGLPGTTNVTMDLFPVNTFAQTTATVPSGTIPSGERLWRASRRNTDNTITDLDVYLHKYAVNGVVHLDFYALTAAIDTSNFLKWPAANAHYWTRVFTGPSNATGYRTILATKN